MFERHRLLIIEQMNTNYGEGPRILPAFGDSTRYTDTPDPARNDKALTIVRQRADKIRKQGKTQLPVEMPFDGPRWKESK